MWQMWPLLLTLYQILIVDRAKRGQKKGRYSPNYVISLGQEILGTEGVGELPEGVVAPPKGLESTLILAANCAPDAELVNNATLNKIIPQVAKYKFGSIKGENDTRVRHSWCRERETCLHWDNYRKFGKP